MSTKGLQRVYFVAVLLYQIASFIYVYLLFRPPITYVNIFVQTIIYLYTYAYFRI